jgi:hypothetical protein
MVDDDRGFSSGPLHPATSFDPPYLFTFPCYIQVNHLGGWSNDLKDYSTPQGHEGPQR